MSINEKTSAWEFEVAFVSSELMERVARGNANLKACERSRSKELIYQLTTSRGDHNLKIVPLSALDCGHFDCKDHVRRSTCETVSPGAQDTETEQSSSSVSILLPETGSLDAVYHFRMRYE